MNFPAGLFGDAWAYGAWLPLGLVLAWCLRTAPWRRLADSGQSNVWLGTIVVLILVWSMKAGVRPGQDLHLLGVVAFTLMFGRQLAIAGLCAVLAAVTYNSGLGWQPYALNALVMAVFPSLLAHGVLRVAERWLPANIFIYFFFGAFFNAAVTTVATGLFASGLLAAAGIYTPAMLAEDYLPYFLLLGFAEAWLNGAAITLMVVYFPDWVGSFDDRRYLRKR
jgi:uncharacterized membrane protein